MSDIRLAIHFSDPSLLTRGSRGVLPEPVPADLEQVPYRQLWNILFLQFLLFIAVHHCQRLVIDRREQRVSCSQVLACPSVLHGMQHPLEGRLR